jgi:hypothetical protein
VIVELKPRHSEYGQVASLFESSDYKLFRVKKTYTFSLQQTMQQSLQSSSASEANFYFYVALVLLLNKIFNSPIGFESVFPATSAVVLTCEPSGETLELICMASNAERTSSKWQAEAKYVMPVYLIEYGQRFM